ncbi:MAG: glycine cleavage system transcriptional repressor [Acidimicrobiales bacterium]
MAVTVIGPDAPGIVAAVTAVLADLGANLEDTTMTILRGQLAMTLIAAGCGGPEVVERALGPVGSRLGLLVAARSVRPLPPRDDTVGVAPPAPLRHVLTVHGADHPGIVAAVTALVARRGGNIVDLRTTLCGGLYVVTADVDLPGSTDVQALATLSNEMTAVAQRLGVEAIIRLAGDDTLL